MSAPVSTLHPALHNMDLSSRTHQLVVIAKPSPDRPYCQIASAFQSCCCSRNILEPCLNALRVLSDESKRVGILQELQFATECEAANARMTLPADDFYKMSGQKEADSRFPYITSALVSSMAICYLDQDHTGYHCSLEAPFHTVNNGCPPPGEPLYEDCITAITVGVIDITDPRKPRYCFLNMDKKCIKCGLWWYGLVNDNIMDELAPWDIMDFTPLSCEAFLSGTAVDSDNTIRSQNEARNVEALEALRVYPLVDIAALASCWPAKAWNSSGQLEAFSNQSPVAVHQGAPKRGPRSLSEHAQSMTLDAIFSELLDDLDLLNEPLLFSGFSKSFLSICAARVDELAAFKHQDMVGTLLARLLEGTDHVNLYPFRQLPVSTVFQVLQSDRLREMKSLNLSGIFGGCPQEIWTTLDAIPYQPEVVYLLSPPNEDKASEEAAVMRSIPHYNGQDQFWEQLGSTKIILSGAISTALKSYCSIPPSANLNWKHMYLTYLRELVSGDTHRLQLLPHTTWW